MRNITVSVFLVGAAALSACNQGTITTNVNSNIAAVNSNINGNANFFNPNSNVTGNTVSNVSPSSAVSSVDTREPDKYQAKVTIRLETIGDQNKTALPTVSANVARDGTNRRMEITLPGGEKIIYLDSGDKHLLVSPNRKQYAELNKESVGTDVRNILLPEQIVNQVKNQKGVEKIGEEQLNGRTVTKYRYASATNTQTKAGEVQTESFLLVDKDTGLPLRSETVSQSQSGGVQGVSGIRVVTEMTDIKSDVTPDLFAEPTDFKKVEPSEVRSQLDLVFRAITALAGQMISAGQGGGAANQSNSPAR
jgi:hypothetical protein